MNAAPPAYAAEIAQARRRGLTLRDPTVSVLLHWGRRPVIGYGVCVPDDKDPGALNWDWTRDLEVIVLRRGDAPARVIRACDAIAACRPHRLLVVDCGDSRTISIIEPRGVRYAA